MACTTTPCDGVMLIMCVSSTTTGATPSGATPIKPRWSPMEPRALHRRRCVLPLPFVLALCLFSCCQRLTITPSSPHRTLHMVLRCAPPLHNLDPLRLFAPRSVALCTACSVCWLTFDPHPIVAALLRPRSYPTSGGRPRSLLSRSEHRASARALGRW
jgi:hypothetical protein